MKVTMTRALTETGSPCCFGRFRLDSRERQLLHDGVPVALQPKVFDTLVLLLGRPGKLFEKAEIMNALWPGISVGESALTKNISALRKVLTRGTKGDSFIQTVPKFGYRFAEPVKSVEHVAMATTAAYSLVTEW